MLLVQDQEVALHLATKNRLNNVLELLLSEGHADANLQDKVPQELHDA